MEQNLESTKNAVQRPNQTVITFFYSQCNIRFCIVMKNNASSIRQFWLCFCYTAFNLSSWLQYFPKLIVSPEKGAHSRLHFPIPSNGQKNFLQVKSRLCDSWSFIVLKSSAFCTFWYKIQVTNLFKKKIFFISLEKQIIRRNAIHKADLCH